MRIDQVDPMVILHVLTAKDGTRSIVVRGMLRGGEVARFEMPVDLSETADLRGHASELCARTLDAIGAIAHTMPDDTGDPTSVATATGADLDRLADLAGVPRHGDRVGGVLDQLADQLGIPRSRVANAYNAMRGDRTPPMIPGDTLRPAHSIIPATEAANPRPPHRMMLELTGADVEREVELWTRGDYGEREALITFFNRTGRAPGSYDQLRAWIRDGAAMFGGNEITVNVGAADPTAIGDAVLRSMARRDQPPPPELIRSVPDNEAMVLIEIWHTLDSAERNALIEFVNRFARTPTPDELRTFRMLRESPRPSPTARGGTDYLGTVALGPAETEGLRRFRAHFNREPNSIAELRAWMMGTYTPRPAPTSVPSGGTPTSG